MGSRRRIVSARSKRFVTRCIGVAWLLLAQVACHPQPPPALPPPGLNINDATRLAAMLSIHANAIWPDRKFPTGIRPLPLPDAIRILNNDKDRLAPSRKRRAIAELWAYGFDRDRFSCQLSDLGVDKETKKRIEGKLKELINTHGGLIADDVTLREMIIGNMLVHDIGALQVDGCSTRDLLPNVVVSGPAVTAVATVTVERDALHVSRALDPRYWHQSGKFWRPPGEAWLAHLSTSSPTGWAPDPPPPLPATDATYGESGNRRFLYEHFVCAVPGCGAYFTNVLWVLTKRTALPNMTLQEQWSLDFALNSSLGGNMLGENVTLREDRGGAVVKPISDTECSVSMGKTLLFENQPGASAMAAAALMSNEVAGELAEIVCYDVKP